MKEIDRILARIPRTLAITSEERYRKARQSAELVLSTSDLTNAEIEDAFDEILPIFETAAQQAESLSHDIHLAIEKAKATQADLQGRLKNVQRGGTDLHNAGRLISILGNHGITATPVCDLIRISDERWQAAIEAFLGRNRESLIVQPGCEEQAVALTRTGAGREAAFRVAIVAPAHLDGSTGDQRPGFVGSLIGGSNDTAVRYVRFIIGAMRCVETEAELTRTVRALTIDGMLAANAGIRPLRLPAPHEFMVGQRQVRGRAAKLRDDITKVGAELVALQNDASSLGLCRRDLGGIIGSRTKEAFFDLATERDIAIARLDSLETSRKALADGKSSDLLQLEEKAKKQIQQCRERVTELAAEQSRTQEALSNADLSIARFAGLMQEIEVELVTLKEHPLFRENKAAEVRIWASNKAADTSGRVKECERAREQAEYDRTSRSVTADRELRSYLSRNMDALSVDHTDWNAAYAFVQNETVRLRDTTLVERKAQAEEAKLRAQESFERDVAYLLRERVSSMRIYLKNLNDILRKCPPFSNGERYRFKEDPWEEGRRVLEFIERSSKNQVPSIFDTIELRDTISRLIENAGKDDAAVDISDFRSFFTFDLLIERDGVTVGRLSARQGYGSGGEHRTPLFVVAGAALATAYRIKVDEPNDTFGLMLVDEAFSNMDAQNTLAVGKFLEAIGIQLLMAAQPGEGVKLLPFTQLGYDLTRISDSVIIDYIEFRAETPRLLTSDMPSEHPELIRAEVERVRTAI